MRIAKPLCSVILLLLLYATVCRAQSTSTSPSVTTSLDSLKRANLLTDWLYLRLDYSYNNPKQTLGFLMETEKQMWRKPANAEEKEALMLVFSNQAYNQLFSGNILESINRYERAYNYYTEHHLNVAGVADYILKPWANNYTRLGDYEKALFIQKQTLNYALKERDSALIAGSYNNMGISFRSLGNLQEAERSVKRGLNYLSNIDPLRALLNNTLADVYKDRGDTEPALRIVIQNIDFQGKTPLSFESAYWLMSSYITCGDIYLLKDNLPLSEICYQKALQINNSYYNGDRLRELAYITTQLGVLSNKAKLPAKALNYYNQTLALLGVINNTTVDTLKIFGENRLVDVFKHRAAAYQQMGNLNEALSNLQLSLYAADKIRFELGDTKTKQRFQADTKEKAEQAIDLAFNLLQATGQYSYAETILGLLEQTKARTLLDDIRRNNQRLTIQTKDPLFKQKQEIERAIAYNQRESLLKPQEALNINLQTEALKFKLESLDKKLKQKYPALSAEEQHHNTAAALLNSLPLNSHFVSYFFGKENLYALEIQNRKVKHIRKITGASKIKAQITSFVDQYYRNGADAMMAEPKTFFEESYRIYHTLIGGLIEKNRGNITIIPDGVLAYLSFDGLITNNSYTPAISAWPFLIKQFNVSYGFSLQTLNSSTVKTSAKQQGNSFSGLFITHEGKDNKHLPAVTQEANAIQQVVNGSFYKDKDATAVQFGKAFQESSVLHISTHAYLSGSQQEPSLALYDGSVFLFELFAKQSAPALVVLSACRTADGSISEGEGIMSLSRGFTALGAGGTIAGLWNVNDQAAAIITSSCYQELLHGKSVDRALHRAKLAWLQGNRNSEMEYLPYYWDSLVYIGNEQSLKLEPATFYSNYKHYVMAAVGLFIAGTIFLILKRWRIKQG